MNKILSKIKAIFDATELDEKLVRNRMDKAIKKYLFLFHGNIYTTSMEFGYRENEWEVDKGWFVNIVYHPNSLLSISTGTYEMYQGCRRPVFDKPPDINKVIKAFKKRMERRTKNTKGKISRMEDSVDLIEQIKGVV